MADEGAGGPSTVAIERCIDNWADETQDGAEIPAAREELAALREAAGRATAPTVWLGVDPPLTEDERAMVYDPTIPDRIRVRLALRWIGGLRSTAGPGAAGAPDGPLVSAARDYRRAYLALGTATDEAHALHALREAEARLQQAALASAGVADGPGAAGARDETAAAQEAVIAAARSYLAYIGYRYDEQGTFIPPRELAAVADALAALDAPRAGGAGEEREAT